MSALPAVAQPASVRAMFDGIAPAYDRFNAWASLGLHQSWRKALIRHIPEGARVLDLATGTGDVAFLARARGHEVVGLDFSRQMLERAREKDKKNEIKWVEGSAERLTFSDASFGCVTSAFALRNIRTLLDAALAENYRVLRSGGRVLHMDFGRPGSPLSRWGHKLHMAIGVPFIGQLICGERWPKHYLKNTIEEFFEPSEMESRLCAAGFKDVGHTPILGGVVQLYTGTK